LREMGARWLMKATRNAICLGRRSRWPWLLIKYIGAVPKKNLCNFPRLYPTTHHLRQDDGDVTISADGMMGAPPSYT
jgi:hypothetical protein